MREVNQLDTWKPLFDSYIDIFDYLERKGLNEIIRGEGFGVCPHQKAAILVKYSHQIISKTSGSSRLPPAPRKAQHLAVNHK